MLVVSPTDQKVNVSAALGNMRAIGCVSSASLLVHVVQSGPTSDSGHRYHIKAAQGALCRSDIRMKCIESLILKNISSPTLLSASSSA